MTTDQIELFAAPRPAPVPPTPGTIKHATLSALIAGPVTQATFTESWRLAEYVRQLIADHWAIRAREVPYNFRIIAEYRLDMDDDATRAAVAAHLAGAV
ncbi:MAG: hypothetical protein IV103_04025 [Zoogloea sp.]|nr:hypothetical protein [Zoogloea sp.]